MKIVLIRHGATKGNLEKRYIGRTDEDLCGEGIKKLKEYTCAGIYPPAQAVFSSPMKRCLSTAECIYPVQTPQIVWNFRECDFGLFEGKNYKELTGNPQYQQWIDSNGTLPFPGGEALTDFKKRSVRAFLEIGKHFKRTGNIGKTGRHYSGICRSRRYNHGGIVGIVRRGLL